MRVSLSLSFIVWHLPMTYGDERVIVLEHSLSESGNFNPRGSIIVTPKNSRNKIVRLANVTLALVGEEKELLARLAQDKGMYRLRGRAGSSGPWASTSIPVCWLAGAGFVEELEVQLDAKGNLMSISYRNLAPTDTCPVPDDIVLESSVQASLDVVGQIIPLQVTGAKPPPGFFGDGRNGGDDAQPDDRPVKKGFFARYWHIIIPVTLIFLTIKGDPPASSDDKPSAEGGPTS